MKKIIAAICAISLCISSTSPVFASSNVNSYAVSIDRVGEILRTAMTQRSTEAIVKYRVISSTQPDEDLLAEEIFDFACKHTGKSNEGDALKWAWKTWNCDVSCKRNGNYYDLTFRYNINFYTTPEQERELLSAISALKSELQLEGKTESEKIAAIYNYICEHVTYDYEHLYDNSYDLKFTDYAALVHKTSLCQGYAVLFYRLALEYGIDARVISGNASDEPHGWNIVKIGDLYYYIDTTWDAEREPDEYYLKGSESFLQDHFCDDGYEPGDLIGVHPVSKSDFDGEIHTHDLETVLISAATCKKDGVNRIYCKSCDYEMKEKIDKLSMDPTHHEVAEVKLSKSIYTYDNKSKSPKVIVKNCKGEVLEKGTDYVVSVPRGRKNVGRYTYTIKFKGKYSGEKQVTLTIKPAKPVIKAPAAAKKAITIKWQKVKKQASGYEVMYSTSKSFKKGNVTKTKTVAKVGKTSVKVTNLKAKTKYYVKVRSYKNVKVNGKNTKIYSAWSDVKKCKTK